MLVVIERRAPPPLRAVPAAKRNAAEVGLFLPTLPFDALFLFRANTDEILPAAIAAGMAIPVLHQWQRMERNGHETAQESRARGNPVHYTRMSHWLRRMPDSGSIPDWSCA